MKTYEFDMVLKGIAEITDTQADALFSWPKSSWMRTPQSH